MKRRISSIVIALSMLLSMAMVPAQAATDITQIPDGKSFYTQDFSDTSKFPVGQETKLTTANSGFSAVYNSNTVDYVSAVDPTNSGNMAMRVKNQGLISRIHATGDIATSLASAMEIIINDKKYKYMEYDYDKDGDTTDETFYIANKNSSEKDLYWIKKECINANTFTGTGTDGKGVEKTDLGYWFNFNADGTIKSPFVGEAGNSNIALPGFSNNAVATEELVYQFDYYYPESDIVFSAEEGFQLGFDGQQFYAKETYFKLNGTQYVLMADGATEQRVGTMNMMAKADGAPSYIPKADKDTYLKNAEVVGNGGEWHTIMLRINQKKGCYTIYIDDMPVYMPTANGYGCNIKMTGTDYTVKLLTQRYCTYIDRAPYFDDFKAYYVEYQLDKYDISEIAKSKEIFAEDFTGATPAVASTSNTDFASFSHATADTHTNASTFNLVNDTTNTDKGVIMHADTNRAMSRATLYDAQFATSTMKTTINSKEYTLIDIGNSNIYLAKQGTSKVLYWVLKSCVSQSGDVYTFTGTEEGKGTDRTHFGSLLVFNDDGTVKDAAYNNAGAASVTMPKPESSQTVTQLAYQFDAYYPSISDWGNEEGYNWNLDNTNFYMRPNGVKLESKNSNFRVLTDTDATEDLAPYSVHGYILNKDNAPAYVASSDFNTYLKNSSDFIKAGQWHTTMVIVNIKDGYYTIYFNGLPVYFKSKSNNYSCRVIIENTTVTASLITGRLNTYADNEPYFDNFIGAYTVETVDGLDIREITGGTPYYTQDFEDTTKFPDGTVITLTKELAGFRKITNELNVTYKADVESVTTAGAMASNSVMRADGNYLRKRPTDEEYDAITASTTTFTWNNKTWKAIPFGDDYYYVMASGAAKNSYMRWVKKSSVVGGVLASKTEYTDYGTWFNVDANNTVTGPRTSTASGSSFVLPSAPEGSSKYAIQFDFAYPKDENLFTNEEGLNISYDGKTEFFIRPTGIVRGDKNSNISLWVGENKVNVYTKNTTGSYVPKKTINIASSFATEADATENLTGLSPFYNDGEWHTVMMYVDTVAKYYTIYYDGLPVYFKTADNQYSCRFVYDATTCDDVTVQTNRGCVYVGHEPEFDNFLAYNFAGTPQEQANKIVDGITLPYVDDFDAITGDILFDVNESKLVAWSFSNDMFIIDESNPLIARYNAPYGWSTSEVTLTATCVIPTDGVNPEGRATKDFVLTVQDKPYYTVNTILIEDEDGNRIYRHKDNSVIKSVSYTANTEDSSMMYLAIYEGDRFVSCKKATPANGKVEFNQSINANQTFKVFVWAGNGSLKPLSLVGSDEYYAKNSGIKVYNIGDSIGQDYGETSGLGGWGQYMNTIFDSNTVTVNNKHSVGGRSAKYALKEDRLKDILANTTSGDYIFLMLAHNDEKLYEYYGATIEEFKMLLEEMILAARAKGVTMILLTPVARPYVSWVDSSDINNQEQNKNPDGTYIVTDSHKDYSAAIKEVADLTGSPIIDVDAYTRNAMIEHGLADSSPIRPYYATSAGYTHNIDTHLSKAGARDWVVPYIKAELAKMNLPISEYLSE